MTCTHPDVAGVRCTACGARLAPSVRSGSAVALPGITGGVLIGSGGGGRVVRGRDAGGRAVVVKLAPAERTAWLANEARFLELAGAPRLLGRGVAGDEPYLVLEDLGDDVLAARFGAPLDPWALAARVLAALVELHARGVRHGDLKPENVVLVGERAVLLDLGSAGPLGGGAASPAASADYAAPEVWRAPEEADGRADVYSAGVMIFELFTGRVPFAGTAAEVRRAHALAAFSPAGVPPSLAPVIARCLAKDPADRYPTAAALAAAFAEAAAHPDVVAPAPLPAGAPPPDDDLPELLDEPAALPAVALVGRDRQIAQLLGSAAQSVALALPTLATVIAEPGFGKTRLHEALRAALAADATADLVDVSAESSDGPAIDGTLRALLVPLLGAPSIAALTRAHLAAVAGDAVATATWPALALTLGLDAGGDVPAAAAPGAIRQAVARGLAACLRARAARRPLRLLVDDAHLADDVTLEACEQAAAPGGELPLWICVLARPELEAQRPGWGERAERHERLQLPGLAPAAAEQLVRRLLEPAVDVPAAIVATLVELGEGVPLRFVELIGELRRRGGLRRHAAGDGWYVAADHLGHVTSVPSIAAMVARDLDAMGSALAWHARLGAVLGSVFDGAGHVAVAARVADGSGLDARVALTQMRRRGVLIESDGRMRFRHALVREAIRASTPPALARAFHAAAYAVLADRDDPEERAALAVHAARAGLPIAAQLHHDLARRARARHAYLAAERHAGEVLALDATPAVRIDALRIRADARHRSGRTDDALADLEAAAAILDDAADHEVQAELALDRAILLDWAHRHADAAAHVAAADAHLAALGDAPGPLAARRLVAHGRTAWRRGDHATAVDRLRAGIALADAAGAAAYESRVVGRLMLGTIEARDAATAESAWSTFADAIALCERHGDQLHLAAALNNRRHVWLARGQLAEAIADVRAIIAISRDLGMAPLEWGAAFNAAEMLLAAGRAEEAHGYLATAIAIERRRGGRATARLLQLRLLLAEGQHALARERRRELDAADLSADERAELAALAQH